MDHWSNPSSLAKYTISKDGKWAKKLVVIHFEKYTKSLQYAVPTILRKSPKYKQPYR